MDYFFHHTSARYAPLILKIEHDYSLAGIGFYWKAVELLLASNTKIPINDFQKLRYTQIDHRDCEDIIKNSGLFEVEDDYWVSLKKDVYNGIDKITLDQYFKNLELFSASPACAPESSPAENCAGVCACSIDMDKKKTDREADGLLNKYMDENFPHLNEMVEPLTKKQFDELRSRYSKEEIEDIFTQMENKLNLVNNNRSCYLTARSWLKHSYGKRKKINKSSNHAGQEHSNTSDGSQDAEQS